MPFLVVCVDVVFLELVDVFFFELVDVCFSELVVGVLAAAVAT